MSGARQFPKTTCLKGYRQEIVNLHTAALNLRSWTFILILYSTERFTILWGLAFKSQGAGLSWGCFACLVLFPSGIAPDLHFSHHVTQQQPLSAASGITQQRCGDSAGCAHSKSDTGPPPSPIPHLPGSHRSLCLEVKLERWVFCGFSGEFLLGWGGEMGKLSRALMRWTYDSLNLFMSLDSSIVSWLNIMEIQVLLLLSSFCVKGLELQSNSWLKFTSYLRAELPPGCQTLHETLVTTKQVWAKMHKALDSETNRHSVLQLWF